MGQAIFRKGARNLEKKTDAYKAGCAVLEEVYKATSMGVAASDYLLPKVADDTLRTQVERQRDNYQGMAQKAADLLKARGQVPHTGTNPMQKAMLWGSIQMETMADRTTSHMAQMMIEGSTMGIVDMQKRLNDLPPSQGEPRKLAEEFIEGEQHSIENLKKLL